MLFINILLLISYKYTKKLLHFIECKSFLKYHNNPELSDIHLH